MRFIVASATPAIRLLRRTLYSAVGTEHAAVAGFRSQQSFATYAVVKELARVRRHPFHAPMSALRTSDLTLENDPGCHRNPRRAESVSRGMETRFNWATSRAIIITALAVWVLASAASESELEPKSIAIGGGITLHYVEQGSGIPVIFVHGSLSDY